MLTLNVTDLNGKRFRINIRQDSYVRDLRKVICTAYELETTSIILFHKKRRLHGRKVLSHYLIQKEDDLVIFPRRLFSGNSFPKTSNAFHFQRHRYEDFFIECIRKGNCLDTSAPNFLEDHGIQEHHHSYGSMQNIFLELEQIYNELETDTVRHLSSMRLDQSLVARVYEMCDHDEEEMIACLTAMI